MGTSHFDDIIDRRPYSNVRERGRLTSAKSDGSAWVSFENIQKKTTRGPAGPHLVLFDPSIPLAHGEH